MAIAIEFGGEDLRRTRVAAAPDLMWELVLSVHTLRNASPPPQYRRWQRSVRRALRESDDTSWLRVLLAVIPGSGNFPDFLTPGSVGDGIDAALDHVMSTPTDRLVADLQTTYAGWRRPPTWARKVVDGDREPVTMLVHAMRRYHEIALAPYLDQVVRRVELDRAARARQLVDSGLGRMLDELNPTVELRDDVLVSNEYPCFCVVPDEAEERRHVVRLGGRGITLVPAHFSWGGPVKLLDPDLDPVLVYPADADIADAGVTPASADPLGKLLGRTRARLLRAVVLASSTTDLARRLNVSPSSVSEHMTVLRDAGLVVTTRAGMSVQHALTSRGRSLLS